MKNNKKVFIKCFIPLCLSVALMLSGYALAVPGENGGGTPDIATQAELDAEIEARQQADEALQLNLNNAIAAQETIDGSQNATIQALQSALTQAQADVADLRTLVNRYHPKRIGDYFGGGVIFYVDETGQHGLIAALADLSDGVDNFIPWYNGVYKVTGATGDGIGAGASNTAIIVAAQAGDGGNGLYAAKLASDFSVQEDGVTPCTGAANETCYGDWYLPSKYELNLLYQQKDVVGGFADDYYWSSTEYDANYAWRQYFFFGRQYYASKEATRSVRAVRAF